MGSVGMLKTQKAIVDLIGFYALGLLMRVTLSISLKKEKEKPW